jgi:MFS family permease
VSTPTVPHPDARPTAKIPTGSEESDDADSADKSDTDLAEAAVESQESTDRVAAWRVLGRRRFGVYFAGSLLSNLGTWLQNTAQMLLAYQLTHSALAVGLVSMAQFSGFLLLGPFVTPVVNRLGRKRVLVVTQMVSAAIAAWMAMMRINGTLTETGLVVGALGIGLAFTFALPIQTAMVSRLVPEEDTKAALAMNSVSYNSGRTLAPVLAVVVLASIGGGWAFALNAFSFAAFAIIVIAIYPGHEPAPLRERRDWVGLRIAAWRPRILLLLAIIAAVTFAEDPVLVLGPSIAHNILAVSSSWPAYFLSALGLGTIIGSILPTKPALSRTYSSAQSRTAAFWLLVLAIAMLVFVLSPVPWLTIVAAAVAGMAGLLTGATAQSLLLRTVDPRQATQVMALWAIAWAGSKPIASLLDGLIASASYVWVAGLTLIAPAFAVALFELFLSSSRKDRIKVRYHTLRIAK